MFQQYQLIARTHKFAGIRGGVAILKKKLFSIPGQRKSSNSVPLLSIQSSAALSILTLSSS